MSLQGTLSLVSGPIKKPSFEAEDNSRLVKHLVVVSYTLMHAVHAVTDLRQCCALLFITLLRDWGRFTA